MLKMEQSLNTRIAAVNNQLCVSAYAHAAVELHDDKHAKNEGFVCNTVRNFNGNQFKTFFLAYLGLQ
jgi:hypothetical protein